MEKKGIFTFRKFLVIIISIFLIGLLFYHEEPEIAADQPSLSDNSEKTEAENEKNEGLFTETEYISIEDKFYLKMPENFKQLDEEIITEKYTGDVPDIVFTNDEININIAISLTENQITDSQIKEYKEFMETLLKSIGKITDTDYYNVDNHNVGQIKIISDAVDTQIYNNMIFFSYDGKLVLISFNCTVNLQDEWEDVGDSIIRSLSFKKK